MALKICIAGATGWTGSALVDAILKADDLQLVGAVARKAAGQDIGAALGRAAVGVKVQPTVAAALDAAPTDVLIEYSSSTIAKANALTAIARGVAVVLGTSGLAAEDFAKIEIAARAKNVGVIASGNFSITASLLQRFAELAVHFVDHYEIIDYASAGKLDTPSGTARELADRLGAAKPPKIGKPVVDLNGPQETRGASIAGVQVHAVRLPGYVLSVETQFGLPGERLTIRHDAGESALPYVAGTLVAARKVGQINGLVRGFDRILFGDLS
ncbi:MAG: 4-hydroxy-tetrahydrodipicolinate reductase [Alphaproteobacteria bacterium]